MAFFDCWIERILIWQKKFIVLFFHSIIWSFDAGVDEKFSNVIYIYVKNINIDSTNLLSSHRILGDRQYFQRIYVLKVDIKHLVITNFMVLITNFAQEICYELLRNSITFYNSLIIKVFWPMHFFRLNILQSLFCCNICLIQSDYPIFFFKSLVENNSQNWKFAFLSKPTLQNFKSSNCDLK